MSKGIFGSKRFHWGLLALAVLIAAQGAWAHLPGYEGERVRNDNHDTEEGFAWPVRGECDINAVGPTDPNAGSANEYLGFPNVPPNFFCAFTTQDAWSFDYPADIIESSRTPSPPAEPRPVPVSAPDRRSDAARSNDPDPG
jgi:hypothetical protein